MIFSKSIQMSLMQDFLILKIITKTLELNIMLIFYKIKYNHMFNVKYFYVLLKTE